MVIVQMLTACTMGHGTRASVQPGRRHMLVPDDGAGLSTAGRAPGSALSPRPGIPKRAVTETAGQTGKVDTGPLPTAWGLWALAFLHHRVTPASGQMDREAGVAAPVLWWFPRGDWEPTSQHLAHTSVWETEGG